jgi:peptidoglycan/xylan/chitin deacetylase (PgdA/CDA1 family)
MAPQLTSLAVFYPDMVRDLMRRGHEIAYHADVHFGFKGDAPQEQELRIRFMKQQMQAILGDSVHLATGFRAPTESYDATTETLLRKHGLLHHAADESAHEDRLPFFSVSEPMLRQTRPWWYCQEPNWTTSVSCTSSSLPIRSRRRWSTTSI